MERILVFGGSGLLGARFCELQKDAFEIIAPTHDAVNVTDEAALRGCIRETKPSQILYAAGFARMDAAEKDPQGAFRLNAQVPEWIADEAARLRVPVCLLSTNAVFSGTRADHASRENDPTDPTSVYGKSKAAGEEAILHASSANSVLRLISLYSATFAAREDFARRIAMRLRSGQEVEAIADDLFNPLFVDRAVLAISVVLHAHAFGVYHLGATDDVSNAGFARMIASAVNADPALIRETPFQEFWKQRPDAAPRGAFAHIDTSKFRQTFGDNILVTNEQSVNEFISLLPKV